MSKRSLENLKQERIKNLFENIEFGNLEFKTQQESRNTGWTWECDHEGNYISCSSEIESILNVSLPAILGKPVTRFMVCTKYHSMLEAALKSNICPVEVDLQLKHADGRLIQARICILKQQQKRDNDHAYGFSGFTYVLQENQQQSISTRLPANESSSKGVNSETLQHPIPTPSAPGSQYLRYLQNSNAQPDTDISLQKYRFLTEMGMELRTSVNSILGFSRVILKGIHGPITDPLRHDIHAIYDSGIQIIDLTDDIIDFSKIESGILELNLEENVNLADMIVSLANTTKGFFLDNAIELILEVPPDLPSIRADPIKTRKILLRLLTIAAKLTNTGIITITAKYQSSGPAGNGSMIHVSIDGEFLIPVDPRHLFNPFLPASESKQEDLSLSKFGLYNAKKLVEMHGGQMGLHYEPGKLCNFYFTLPVNKRSFMYPKRGYKESNNGSINNQHPYQKTYESEAKALTQIDNVFQTSSDTGQLGKTRIILLIDDDRANIDLIKEVFLQSHDQLVVEQGDTTNVVENIRFFRPGVIILNPQMHNLDVQHILRSLTKEPFLKSIPIIILTSNSLEHTLYHSINDSAIVLHKGLITGQDLRNVVSNVTSS